MVKNTVFSPVGKFCRYSSVQSVLSAPLTTCLATPRSQHLQRTPRYWTVLSSQGRSGRGVAELAGADPWQAAGGKALHMERAPAGPVHVKVE